MPRELGKKSALALLALGLALTLACFALLYAQPRGPHEFAYAPFIPDALPWSPMRGFTWEQAHSHLYRLVLLGPGLILLSLGLSRFWRPSAFDDRLWRRVALASGAFAIAVTALLMVGVLRGRALIDDELTYRMQASILAEGRLELPSFGDTPDDPFTIETAHGYTGKYLPGEGLVQIPGLWLGIPALSHLLLAAGAIWLWYRTLRFRFAESTSCLAAALLALSPMLVFTSATGLSHTTALFFVVVGAYGFELCRAREPELGAALVGLSFSLCFLTRPQVAIPAHGVLAVATAWQILKTKRWSALLELALPALLGLATVAAYNDVLSGSWRKLPWFLHCNAEHYGFGKVWPCDSYVHTPLRALENLGVVAVRFNAFWLGLPFSFGLLFLWRRLAQPLRGGGVWLAMGAAVLLFELGYYSTGVSDTGPIYHFELLLPASLLGAHGIQAAWQRFPTLAPAAVLVHLGLGTASFYVEHGLRLSRLAETIHGAADRALATIKDRPALLLHEFRSSEVLRHGWILDTFPKRFRSWSDPIVTMPRVPTRLLQSLQETYPGRACYYFHRVELSGEPELLRCEDAEAFLDRRLDEDDIFLPRSLWVAPTAYTKVSDFNPLSSSRYRIRDWQGRACITCCSLRKVLRAGGKVDPTVTCVGD